MSPDTRYFASRALKGKANGYGRAAGHVDATFYPLASPYCCNAVDATLRRDLYRDWIVKGDSIWAEEARARLPRLRGKVIVCTCRLDQPCHVDVLVELANEGLEVL